MGDDRSFSAKNKIDLGRSGVTRQGYHYIGGRFCDGPDTDDSSKFMQYTLDAAINQCNIDDTCGASVKIRMTCFSCTKPMQQDNIAHLNAGLSNDDLTSND